MEDLNKIIVIDNGSSITRAGFSGDECPRSQFETVVGRSKNPTIDGKNIYCGDEAVSYLQITRNYPIEKGIITNWEDIEILWHYIFDNELHVDTSEYHVIFTEVTNNPKPNREKTVQIMFETFNIPGFYTDAQAIFSLYSYGRSTGIVFESGGGASSVVPIKEGRPISEGINIFDISGYDLSVYCSKIMYKNLLPVKTVHPKGFDIHYFDDLKYRCTYVALDYEAELQKAKTTSECDISYTLADGNQITISDQRFTIPELFFKPNLNDIKSDGIDRVIFNSIMKCDESIRKELFENIIISGGNTLFDGLPERLEKEITKLAPPETKVKVIAQPERKHGAWIGGSIIGCLATFPKLVISRDEYNDAGSNIVNIKPKLNCIKEQ